MPSPNFGDRKDGRRPDMIVLHYTGMPDATGALEHLRKTASQVSSHYFVFEDGRVIQMVPESKRAWHAGVSSWAGDNDRPAVSGCEPGMTRAASLVALSILGFPRRGSLKVNQASAASPSPGRPSKVNVARQP